MADDIEFEMNLLYERMKDKGLKITAPREELARWIFSTHDHFTVEDVMEAFRAQGKKVAPATVYRVIQMLKDLDLVAELDFGSGVKYYEHTPGHPHHDHILCTSCGKIVEFMDEALEKRKQEIAKQHGFIMTGHSLHIYGLCANCQKKEKK